MSMDASTIAALYGLVGVIVTSVVAFISTKVNAKKDVTLIDRQTLSADQQQFLENVMNQMKSLQDRADHLDAEVMKWKQEAMALKIENLSLQSKVKHLEGVIGGVNQGE